MRARIKKLFPLPACLLLVSLFTAGCRKPGLATTPASAAAPRAKTTFVYLAALQPLIKIRDSPPAWDTSPALIFAFVPDAITGRLGALAYFPIPTAIEADFIAHDPSNRFDYLADMAEDSIYAYAVNPRNGRLRAIPLSPFAAGREPAALAFTPNGKFLYVAYQALNAVGAYSVDSTTGALTPVPGSPFPTTGTKIYGCCVAVTSDGRYLVAGDQYSIYSYRIDPGTGALTLVSSLPAPVGMESLAIDPKGRYAYAAGSGPQALSTYSIAPHSGKLTLHAATPLDPNDSAGDLVLAPSGRFAYTSQNAGVVLYHLHSGKFSAPLASWRTPATIHLAIDPSGKFLFAAQGGTYNSLYVWLIDAPTGRLRPVPDSPYPIYGSQPTIMVTAW